MLLRHPRLEAQEVRRIYGFGVLGTYMHAGGDGRFDKVKNPWKKIEVKREPKAESRAVVLIQEAILHQGDFWQCLRIFCCCNWEGVLLASRGWKPGTRLNILQCPELLSSQSISSAQVEKHGSRVTLNSQVEGTMQVCAGGQGKGTYQERESSQQSRIRPRGQERWQAKRRPLDLETWRPLVDFARAVSVQ